MTQTHPISRRTGARLAWHLVTAFAGAALCGGVLVAAYAVAPVPDEAWSIGTFALYAVVCLSIFAVVTVMALVRLSKARRPLFEGLAFVSIMAAILVLSYAWLYLVMSVGDPTSFTEQLNKVSSVYFTVTVLATVGFGDITPTGDISRLVVTSQMILGFTLITIAIKTVLSSTTSAVKKRGTSNWLETHQDEALKAARDDVARESAALAKAQDKLDKLENPDAPSDSTSQKPGTSPPEDNSKGTSPSEGSSQGKPTPPST